MPWTAAHTAQWLGLGRKGDRAASRTMNRLDRLAGDRLRPLARRGRPSGGREVQGKVAGPRRILGWGTEFLQTSIILFLRGQIGVGSGFNSAGAGTRQPGTAAMDRYKVVKQLGDGTYGEVLKASNRQTGEVVAVKRMKRKYYSWDECMALQEVKSLRKMKHPNIVKLKEVIREQDILYFVFEFLDQNLYEVSKGRQKFFPESTVRNYMFQVLQGLGYMHRHGYFHRDIKPENILVTGDIAKVADFGLAKAVKARPPHTDYVSTRWYRAPEVLLRSPNYNAPIDIWAVGCMMAELVMLRPLFPGASESDELHRITAVLGTPTPETWKDGLRQAASINYRFPKLPACPLQRLMPHASAEAIKIMHDMMLWDPAKRPTCGGSIQYPFFRVGLDVPAPAAPADAPQSADGNLSSLSAAASLGGSTKSGKDPASQDLGTSSGPPEGPSSRNTASHMVPPGGLGGGQKKPALREFGGGADADDAPQQRQKRASLLPGFGEGPGLESRGHHHKGVADKLQSEGAGGGGKPGVPNSMNLLRQARYVPGVNPLHAATGANGRDGADSAFGVGPNPAGGGARRPLGGGRAAVGGRKRGRAGSASLAAGLASPWVWVQTSAAAAAAAAAAGGQAWDQPWKAWTSQWACEGLQACLPMGGWGRRWGSACSPSTWAGGWTLQRSAPAVPLPAAAALASMAGPLVASEAGQVERCRRSATGIRARRVRG